MFAWNLEQANLETASDAENMINSFVTHETTELERMRSYDVNGEMEKVHAVLTSCLFTHSLSIPVKYMSSSWYLIIITGRLGLEIACLSLVSDVKAFKRLA